MDILLFWIACSTINVVFLAIICIWLKQRHRRHIPSYNTINNSRPIRLCNSNRRFHLGCRVIHLRKKNQMIIFSNPGLIPIEAITTLGVNAKENENPIGYFGTGLKYAIAVLLRENQSITIYRGKDKYTFTKKPTTIRNKLFDLIHMNNQPLGWTVDLGKNWELWHAYRELYSNCIDEDGTVEYQQPSHIDEIPTHENKTLICITGNKFEAVYTNRHKYFLQSQPLTSSPFCEIHPSNGTSYIYYKGIATKELWPKSLFSYNITTDMDLTEDRTFKYDFEIDGHLRKTILQLRDRDIITKIAKANALTYESHLPLSSQIDKPSQEFIQIASEILRTNPDQVNEKVAELIRSTLRTNIKPEIVPPTPYEQSKIQAAINLCKSLGHPVDEFDIKISTNLGENTIGRADGNSKTMYLAKTTLDQGVSIIAGTLLEEWVHLRLGLKDESRALQNWLLNRLIALGEELQIFKSNPNPTPNPTPIRETV